MSDMSSLAATELPPAVPAVPVESTNAPPPAANADTGALSTDDGVHCLSDVLPGASPSSADAASTARKEFMWRSWENVKWGSWKVFIGMQAVGEILASILGLNHSKYQWVIDNMSEDDWKIAREVHRRKEAARLNQPLNDMEGATAVNEPKEAEAVER